MTQLFMPPVAFDLPAVTADTKGVQYALFRHFGGNARGRSVVRVDGTFEVRDYPDQDLLEGLEDGVDYFLGGHEYVVDDDIAAELTADGFSAYLTEVA